MIGIRKEMTEERDDRKAILIILPATTLLVFISIDTIHFHSITNINMAEPNPNPTTPTPEQNPNPTHLLQLMRRKTAEIGRGHFLPTSITDRNALLCLALANTTNQDDFDYVMAYICYNAPGVFDRPVGDFIYYFFSHHAELMVRAFRWLICELNRTDDNNE